MITPWNFPAAMFTRKVSFKRRRTFSKVMFDYLRSSSSLEWPWNLDLFLLLFFPHWWALSRKLNPSLLKGHVIRYACIWYLQWNESIIQWIGRSRVGRWMYHRPETCGGHPFDGFGLGSIGRGSRISERSCIHHYFYVFMPQTLLSFIDIINDVSFKHGNQQLTEYTDVFSNVFNWLFLFFCNQVWSMWWLVLMPMPLMLELPYARVLMWQLCRLQDLPESVRTLYVKMSPFFSRFFSHEIWSSIKEWSSLVFHATEGSLWTFRETIIWEDLL